LKIEQNSAHFHNHFSLQMALTSTLSEMIRSAAILCEAPDWPSELLRLKQPIRNREVTETEKSMSVLIFRESKGNQTLIQP